MTQNQLLKKASDLRSRVGGRRSAFPIKAGGPITALDWDGTTLRVAQSVTRGGRAEVSDFKMGPLQGPIEAGQDKAEVCGARLAKALADLKLKPGAAVMGIPRNLVFLRTLSLPKPPTPEELVAMVQFQISKDLPFRPEEAIVDFQVNASPAAAPTPGTSAGERATESTPAAERVEVLVAVAKREVVEFYQALAEAAGLKLAALGLGPHANARGLKHCGLAGEPRVVALVSLRQQEVVIDILVGETLAFSRTAALALEPLAVPSPPKLPAAKAPDSHPAPVKAAEPAATYGGTLDEITIEVVRSLHNFEGLERLDKVEQILVTGAHPKTGALAEALAQSCHLPCRQLEPLRVLGVHASETEQDAGAFNVLSLALMAQDAEPWSFDFLHPKRPAPPRNLRRRRLLCAGAAALVLVLAGWSVRAHLIHRRIAARDQVAAEIEAALKNRPLFRHMRLNAKTVHDWTLDKREWLDHYARLSALLPDCTEVYITSFSTGAKGVAHISIQARSGDILAQVDKRLRAAGYDLKPLAVTPSSDRYGYGFQSSLELTLPVKTNFDVATLKAPPRPPDDGSLSGKTRASSPAPADTAPGTETKRRGPGRRNQP